MEQSLLWATREKGDGAMQRNNQSKEILRLRAPLFATSLTSSPVHHHHHDHGPDVMSLGQLQRQGEGACGH